MTASLEATVKGEHTGLSKKNLRDVHYVLLSGSPGRTYRLVKKHQAKIVDKIDDKTRIERGLPWYILKDSMGFKYAVATSGMGTSSAEIVMREILQACDPPLYIIRTGTAGTMQPDIGVGQAVIATGAVRAESTSYKYSRSKNDPGVALASPEVIAALEAAAKVYAKTDPEFKHHIGIKISKDSLGWEIGDIPMKKEALDYCRVASGAGILASAMESSLIYSMSERFSENILFRDERDNREIYTGTIVAIVNNYDGSLFGANKEAIQESEANVLEIAPYALKILHLHQHNGKLREKIEYFRHNRTMAGNIIKAMEDYLRTLHPRW